MKRSSFYVTRVSMLALAALAAVPLLAIQARAAAWEDQLQKLYPAAKADGEVIVNTARHEEVGGDDGLAAFKKRFPGIKITFSGASGSQMTSQVIAEAAAGKSSVDVFRSDPYQAAPIADRKLLAPLDMSQLTLEPVPTYFDSSFVKLSDFISNFFYNTDRVKPEDAPKTYEDLLNPKWKGQLTLDARGGQIAHLLADNIWTADRFWTFIDGLKAQNPLWAFRDTEAEQRVVSGEAAIGTGSLSAVQADMAKGAPVKYLFLSPALSEVRGMALVKDAPHPNASKLFIAWLISPEGLHFRDEHNTGVAAPGTNLAQLIKDSNATIYYENGIDGILARDKVIDQITKRWGALK